MQQMNDDPYYVLHYHLPIHIKLDSCSGIGLEKLVDYSGQKKKL